MADGDSESAAVVYVLLVGEDYYGADMVGAYPTAEAAWGHAPARPENITAPGSARLSGKGRWCAVHAVRLNAAPTDTYEADKPPVPAPR